MFVIGSDCIACGACSDSCPAGAISMGDEHYEIDRISAFHAELALTPAPQALFPRNRMSTVHSKSLLQCVCFAAGSLALYAFWRT